jgi:hypothetical protein
MLGFQVRNTALVSLGLGLGSGSNPQPHPHPHPHPRPHPNQVLNTVVASSVFFFFSQYFAQSRHSWYAHSLTMRRDPSPDPNSPKPNPDPNSPNPNPDPNPDPKPKPNPNPHQVCLWSRDDPQRPLR